MFSCLLEIWPRNGLGLIWHKTTAPTVHTRALRHLMVWHKERTQPIKVLLQQSKISHGNSAGSDPTCSTKRRDKRVQWNINYSTLNHHSITHNLFICRGPHPDKTYHKQYTVITLLLQHIINTQLVPTIEMFHCFIRDLPGTAGVCRCLVNGRLLLQCSAGQGPTRAGASLELCLHTLVYHYCTAASVCYIRHTLRLSTCT